MKFCWLTLLIFCYGLLSFNVYANTLQAILQRGVLRVAVPEDLPPFGSIDKSLAPLGYDIDMAHYLAKNMGVKLQLIPVTSANRVAYLQTQKVDLVIASMGKNQARAKVIDFSDAYAPFYLGVFSHQAQRAAHTKGLAGKVIGVTRGAVEDLVLSTVAPSSVIIKRYEDNNTTFAAWLAGQVDAIASGNVAIANLIRQHPNNPPVLDFALKDSPCFIGLRKGQIQLKTKINDLIHQAKLDGTLDRLSLFWLKTPFKIVTGKEVDG